MSRYIDVSFLVMMLVSSQVEASHARTQSCMIGNTQFHGISLHRRTRSSSRSPQYLQVPPLTFGYKTLPAIKLPLVALQEVESKRVLEVVLDNVQPADKGATVIAVTPRLLSLFYRKGNLGALFEKQVAAAIQGDVQAREAACKLIRSGDLKEFLVDVYGQESGMQKLKACAVYVRANVKGLIEKGYICPICHEDVGAGGCVTVPCLHIFCTKCIKRWKEVDKKKSCPLCRGAMHSPQRVSQKS